MIIFGKIQIAKEGKSESEINSSWVNSNVLEMLGRVMQRMK